MLILEDHTDLQTSSGPMRVHWFRPNTLPQHPSARFPGVAVFTEIYQVTGPVERFCRQIASLGEIPGGCPESYHEFEVPGTVIPYDVEGTDRGNRYKTEKTLAAYDEDATLLLDAMASHPNCTGRSARRACTLGRGKASDSLARCTEIAGEMLLIFGKRDTHIPFDGRAKIHKALSDGGVHFSWYEQADAQHAFIRDELSKGRYDPAIASHCFEMLKELFFRKLHVEYGAPVSAPKAAPSIRRILCQIQRQMQVQIQMQMLHDHAQPVPEFPATQRLNAGFTQTHSHHYQTTLTVARISSILADIFLPMPANWPASLPDLNRVGYP
ncbi:Alpha/Beta hydrolase protein [Entophlyctis helioformis]|nr:Alpha/Beta hydrolase protein [Entophlyctis helioformis]